MDFKIGRSHGARMALFQRGLRLGSLTVAEIEEALPEGALTSSERWLLYYSLRAAGVDVVGEAERGVVAAGPWPEESR